MIRRLSLLSGFAALALVAAGGLGSASAGELHRPVVKGPSRQLNKAPTSQRADSFAVAKKGDALSDASNSNTIIQTHLGGRLQGNAAPTRQTARSGAVSIGGSAIASASNSNVVSQGNIK